MEADLTRLPIGTASWRALIDHALSLGDLAEVAYLELKGTLPFRDKGPRKRSAVTLARAVLGMSNRMPDAAARHLQGYGVVLVGVSEQRIEGAEKVDGAVLREALEPYLGSDGPLWDHLFFEHPNGLVMALIVSPPQWGDRIHACRKEYSSDDGRLTVRDGDIFVRLPGICRPANSNDLVNLERRRQMSQHTDVELAVAYSEGFHRVDLTSAVNLVTTAVNSRADSLLEGVTTRSGNSYATMLASISAERRTPEEFNHSVEHWRNDALAEAKNVVHELLRHELATGRWVITNTSQRYLESAQLEVVFPPGVLVLMDADGEYCDHGGSFDIEQVLPERPAKWGSYSVFTGVIPSGIGSRGLVRKTEMHIEASTAGTSLTWQVGDLRPKSSSQGNELFAVVTEEHSSTVVAHWRLTARGIDHVFEGAIQLSCTQDPEVYLVWGHDYSADSDSD